ncbi:hypothetical protein FZEAL_5218 [Fusarium zealandicum]|uniref:DRBM domain-containing protein n=1 Tax=Fusarium zealandicum TaxID=1053134 RepID=A0A8H4UKA5_9HYPO|nr:hypothetical protein FZEAL_5218 [Fusarium zealandicum]
MATQPIEGGIPWDLLIEFANEKKAEEARTGRPAELNAQQKTAVGQLIEVNPEPEVEDIWVAKLNQHCQQQGNGLPEWSTETINVVFLGTPHPRSRAFCVLPWCQQKFPREGYGFEAGQEPPTFKKKQTAKHFAAKQAYEFLTGTSSPRGNKRPLSVAQASPSRTRVKGEEDVSDGGASTAEPSRGGGGRSSVTVRERVAHLASSLGYGLPEYDVEEDGDVEDTWQGRPFFSNDGQVPEDIGVVRGIVGRQRVEDAIAESVLVWLEKESKAKQEVMDKVMGLA